MTTPTWLAATAAYPAQAGQINQFLVAHQTTFVYAGVEQASEGTAGSGGVNSDSLWIAQKFTAGAGQTTTGYVIVKVGAVTGTPAPWTFSLQADNGSGAPSGTALVTSQIPQEEIGAGGEQEVLLPCTGLTPSGVYWIVADAVGDGSDYYTWEKSNQSSGASTSTNGSAWSSQSYGLLFQVYDGTASGDLIGIYEDAGDRWTFLNYTDGVLTGIDEWTVGQAPTGYAFSTRALSYSNGQLTGVT